MILHGVHTPGGYTNVLDFEAQVGRFCPVVQRFASTNGGNPEWRRADFERILDNGRILVLTLELQGDTAAGSNQPDWSHREILSRRWDARILEWARFVASLSRPSMVVIRLMHEANANWYPWCVGVNGNTYESFSLVWIRVRQMFDSVTPATRFEWSVNGIYPGSADLWQLCPPIELFDQVSIDRYNWTARGPWRTFAELFDPTIYNLRQMLGEIHLAIGETSCAEEDGHSKALWIEGMWDRVEEGGINEVRWFNEDKSDLGAANWLVDTSGEALSSYRQGAQRVLPSRTETK